ncbi:MAG: MGH1-like glycoside hydrolase domain-containing protein [Promethearchaeota archaeon]
MSSSTIYNSINEVVDACYNYLSKNLVEGQRWGLAYRFYKPSQTKYGPYQWLWDSGWHMIVWSHKNVAFSIADLRTMLQFQQKDGFIPEMIYWGLKSRRERFFLKFIGYSKKSPPYKNSSRKQNLKRQIFYTDITQMPILPYSIRSIWNATNDVQLLKEFVPKLVKYYDWWDKNRDHDKDGLISIIHPWESGLDASPLYDPAHGVTNYPVKELKYYLKFIKILRKYKKLNWNLEKILSMGYFNFEDVGVCSVYADGWAVLSNLAQNFDKSLSDYCMQKAKYYSEKIIEKCWDDSLGRFVSFYHKGKGKNAGEFCNKIETIQSLFPLLLSNLPKDLCDKVVKNIKDPKKFWTPYPVPSCARSELAFNPNDSRLMWRGPTWGSTNWLIMEGLIKHGYIDLAKEILNRWLDMYMKFGIYEYHNPLTGEGEGQEGLGMATTIVDMLYRFKFI